MCSPALDVNHRRFIHGKWSTCSADRIVRSVYETSWMTYRLCVCVYVWENKTFFCLVSGGMTVRWHASSWEEGNFCFVAAPAPPFAAHHRPMRTGISALGCSLNCVCVRESVFRRAGTLRLRRRSILHRFLCPSWAFSWQWRSSSSSYENIYRVDAQFGWYARTGGGTGTNGRASRIGVRGGRGIFICTGGRRSVIEQIFEIELYNWLDLLYSVEVGMVCYVESGESVYWNLRWKNWIE